MSLSDTRRWERYMQKLEVDDNGCWLWTGKIRRGRGGGYGMVSVDRRAIGVHRLFYERFVAPIPEGLWVLHHCDVRRCVNPEHLYVGTAADNGADTAARGRAKRTQCRNGHPYPDDRTYANGARCVICNREKWQRWARKARAATAATLAIAIVMIPLTGRTAGESVRRGDHGPLVAEVQTILASMSYSVTVDSRFGPETERAVKSWQRSNGLEVDGVVGAITLESLRQAKRVGNQHTVGGLDGRPFAPAGLSDCADAEFYRQQWELPEAFVGIVWRESRCRNDESVHTFCCWSRYQHYISSHLSRQSAYRQRIIDECQVTRREDIDSNTPIDKQRAACVTAVVYQISGLSPWRATA